MGHSGRKRDRLGGLNVTRGWDNPSTGSKQAVSAELYAGL